MGFSGPVEDRIALRNLLDSYADAVCRNDADAWAATWADDGRWELPGFGTFSGKTEIVETWKAAMTGFPGIVFQAWPGAMTIEGDKAIMRSYASEIYSRGDDVHHDLGEYADACMKIEGRWFFASRRFRALRRQEGVS
ncbi:MAG: nuclear transport factor 2 family protein [Sphingopyxis sp.]|nr:nuclear transport factor 2 family protein [Sphingopyxis sp.]